MRPIAPETSFGAANLSSMWKKMSLRIFSRPSVRPANLSCQHTLHRARRTAPDKLSAGAVPCGSTVYDRLRVRCNAHQACSEGCRAGSFAGKGLVVIRPFRWLYRWIIDRSGADPDSPVPLRRAKSCMKQAGPRAAHRFPGAARSCAGSAGLGYRAGRSPFHRRF